MKRLRYAELCRARKQCRRCGWLTNPAGVEDGRFDADEIGPWTRWQGNLDAAVLLCGQDWGDVRCFKQNQGKEPRRSLTNERLIMRFRDLGIDICPPNARDPRTQPAFFTNACLCLKDGGLQARLRAESFRNCQAFLRRTIEIVSPQVVIALGQDAHQAICQSFGLQVPLTHRQGVEADGISLTGLESRLFAVYHCSARVSNSGTRTLDQQAADWRRIGPHVGR